MQVAQFADDPLGPGAAWAPLSGDVQRGRHEIGHLLGRQPKRVLLGMHLGALELRELGVVDVLRAIALDVDPLPVLGHRLGPLARLLHQRIGA
eukprot:11201830-Lingulodinium_polyedra.AAC.1